MINTKRTIESILDLEKGIIIDSNKFFSQSEETIFRVRTQIEINIQNNRKRYVCLFCKQHIKIRGGGVHKTVLHFAHLKDSDDCPIKTDNNYSKEQIERIKYNGAKESELHISLKNEIAHSLNKSSEIKNVRIEKVIKDKAIPSSWKKPDISALFKNFTIVFELQLSTTFLSVIVARQEFYKRNKIFILWVFNHFENYAEKRKFTQSDIFYNNNMNGFEFNKEAQRLSNQQHNLVLCCHYNKPFIEDGNIAYKWEKKYVTLQDLTFNKENYQVYYYDALNEKKRLEVLNTSDFFRIILNGDQIELFGKFTHSKMSDSEYKYLKTLYLTRVKPKNIIERRSVEYLIIIALIAQKLKNTSINQDIDPKLINLFKEYRDSYSIQKLVLAILSLKTNKIIGYAFQNQVQVAHNLLDKYPKFLLYYKKAISEYKTLEIKQGSKLELKIKYIETNYIFQEKKNKIIETLFPELK